MWWFAEYIIFITSLPLWTALYRAFAEFDRAPF